MRTGKGIPFLRSSQKGDIGNANREKMNIYLTTPNGSLQKYNYKTGNIEILSKSIPSDSNDPSRLNNMPSIVEKNPLTFEKILELYRKQAYRTNNIYK